MGMHPGRAGVPDGRPDGDRERHCELRGSHPRSSPGEGHRRCRLGPGLRAAGHARHDHRRRGDGLRVLRTDAVARGPLDDRARHATSPGAVDVARQRPEHQGRLAHLGHLWAGVSMPPTGSWYDQLNPFHYLAGAAGNVVADGWTAAMLGLWNAGLWAMRLVLNIMDAFLTPDLSENGPGADIYRTTFWIAGALVLVMVMIQFGVAAIRRDGKSLATLLVGGAQFTIVWAAWVAYGVAVIAACGGLTRALMGSLLKVSSWSAWQPWAPFTTGDIVDGTVATVLGLMGLLLWLPPTRRPLLVLPRRGWAVGPVRDDPDLGRRARGRRRTLLVLEEPALVPRCRVNPGPDDPGSGHRDPDDHRGGQWAGRQDPGRDRHRPARRHPHPHQLLRDRKSTRLNSSHLGIS